MKNVAEFYKKTNEKPTVRHHHHHHHHHLLAIMPKVDNKLKKILSVRE